MNIGTIPQGCQNKNKPGNCPAPGKHVRQRPKHRSPSGPSGGYSYFPLEKVIVKTRLLLERGGAHGTLLRATDPLVMHTD